MTHKERIEQLVNEHIAAGRHPGKCKVHPKTYQGIVAETQTSTGNPRIREMAPPDQGVLLIEDIEKGVQCSGILYFEESEEVPEGEYWVL